MFVQNINVAGSLINGVESFNKTKDVPTQFRNVENNQKMNSLMEKRNHETIAQLVKIYNQGKITLKEANDRLNDQPVGTGLLRESTSEPGAFTLSFVTYDGIKNIRLKGDSFAQILKKYSVHKVLLPVNSPLRQFYHENIASEHSYAKLMTLPETTGLLRKSKSVFDLTISYIKNGELLNRRLNGSSLKETMESLNLKDLVETSFDPLLPREFGNDRVYLRV